MAGGDGEGCDKPVKGVVDGLAVGWASEVQRLGVK